jgi:SAM-dependent methyltransferase
MASAEYKRLLTQAYDIDKPDAPPEELAFYCHHIEAAQPPVLEVMCGSGRFLVPLLESGVDIDGVDLSEDMLAACRAKCDRRGVNPALHLQRVRELELPRRYGFAFCGGGSFGLIVDTDEARESLRRVFDHLLPGGTLLIEVETPTGPHRSGAWQGRWWKRDDGATIANRQLNRYDPATRVETGLGVYELFADGVLVETELDEWVCRYWEPDELRGLLEGTGFVNINATKAFTSLPLDGDEAMVSFLGVKPGPTRPA